MFPVEEPLRVGWTDQIEFINGSAAVHANGRKYFLGLENVTTPFSPRFSVDRCKDSVEIRSRHF